jgi:hypothetical protein
MCGILVVLMLGLFLTTGYATVSVGEPMPIDEPAGAVCHTTRPNLMTPPAEEAEVLAHSDGRLYVGLPPDGEILADPRFIELDGSVGMKLWWWRAPGVGGAGDLVITGHELASRAPIRASIPEGYGQRFQATGISFPTEGCYEVTGRSGEAALTFVVKVTKVDGAVLAP